MKTLIYIFIFSIFSSSSAFAQEGEASNKNESIFLYGVYGRTIAGDDEKDRHTALNTVPYSHKTGNGYQLGLGYKWNYVGIEVIYGDFGKPAIEYENHFIVEKTVRFAGAGVHWFVWIFDIKLGWASFRGQRKIAVLDSAEVPIEIDPLVSRITSGGNYFGLGLNFNLGADTEIILDYTAYVFREKEITFTIDGEDETYPIESTAEEDKLTGFVGIAGLGLRWYF